MIYARLALFATLAAVLFLGGYKVADWRDKAKIENLQLAWDDDKAAIQKTADEAIAAETKLKEDALANNEAISNDYQKQLAASRANSTELAKRLLKYASAAAAGGSGVSQGADNTVAPDPASAQRLGRLNDALAATLKECRDTRSQLTALQAELKPQL